MHSSKHEIVEEQNGASQSPHSQCCHSDRTDSRLEGTQDSSAVHRTNCFPFVLGCRPQYGIILSLLSLSGDTKECPALLTTKKPASESFSASSSACWLS